MLNNKAVLITGGTGSFGKNCRDNITGLSCSSENCYLFPG